MNVSATSPAPLAFRTLHAPEVWVIMQTFGAVQPNSDTPPEIASDPAAGRKAQATMLKQGSLTRDAAGKIRLAREIEALVRPAVYPKAVVVANLTGPTNSSKPPQVICFNWTPEMLVINWVDALNDHHFEAYPPNDAAGRIWDQLAKRCDWDVEAPKPNTVPPQPEEAVEQMRQTVMLMAVSGVQSPQPVTRALGWFVGGRSAWLMQKDERADQLAPSLAGQADIQKAVIALVQQTLASD